MSIRKIPTLKRHDYIKHFETVVKQEIALHEKKSQQSNERLNTFQRSISNYKCLTDNKLRSFENQISALRKHFDENNHNDEILENHKNSIKNLESNHYKLYSEISKIDSRFDDYALKEFVVDYCLKISKELRYFTLNLSEQVSNLSSEVENLRRTFSYRFHDFDEENLEINKKIKSLEGYINNVLESVKKNDFNSEWVRKSIKKRQKKILYLEKKFEYLQDKIKKLEALHNE